MIRLVENLFSSETSLPFLDVLLLHVMLDGTNRLHLKITSTLEEPPAVQDYQVPIFTCTKEDIESITWDLTIEQVSL